MEEAAATMEAGDQRDATVNPYAVPARLSPRPIPRPSAILICDGPEGPSFSLSRLGRLWTISMALRSKWIVSLYVYPPQGPFLSWRI